jgi:hypothetical protein
VISSDSALITGRVVPGPRISCAGRSPTRCGS